MCQQTREGVLLFYSVSDYLVFFTVYCTVARRYGIPVLALCPMVDHLHNTILVRDEETLSRFVQQYTHLFAREWNEAHGRKGPLIKQRFKSSAKLGNKQVRTTINYNYNNPVERKLVKKAEDYRWNFLRYAFDKAPYSAPFTLSDKSQTFRGVIKEVQKTFLGEGYLHYAQLRRWGKKLSPTEMQQVTDYAIGLWNVIDYEEVISYYGSWEAMLNSFHDNTGYDYEIKEDRDTYSDAVYKDCTRILLKEGYVKNILEVPALPLETKRELYSLLSFRTTARPRQIRKYLHLNAEEQYHANNSGQ